uniref:Uncharacterized protein n=1 Tax=Calidris pygmaea TaxID=425635 RepID=A0A8C3KNM9_9CHAR
TANLSLNRSTVISLKTFPPISYTHPPPEEDSGLTTSSTLFPMLSANSSPHSAGWKTQQSCREDCPAGGGGWPGQPRNVSLCFGYRPRDTSPSPLPRSDASICGGGGQAGR